MSAVKDRRDRLFRDGKPDIRPAVLDDMRWFWAAARRDGFDGTPDQFTAGVQNYISEADSVTILGDTNSEFANGRGPVGVVLANYDGWALVPHVLWFPWATPRNILRCSVGYLHSMRYARGVGVIKVLSDEHNADWFRRLKRYVAISKAGMIPGGKAGSDEHIFYLRGRGQHGQRSKEGFRRERGQVGNTADPAPAGSITTH